MTGHNDNNTPIPYLRHERRPAIRGLEQLSLKCEAVFGQKFKVKNKGLEQISDSEIAHSALVHITYRHLHGSARRNHNSAFQKDKT